LFAHKPNLIFRIEIENPTYTNAGKYFIFFQTDFAILVSCGGRFSLDEKNVNSLKGGFCLEAFMMSLAKSFLEKINMLQSGE
jgi:hypothetical protein